MILAVMKEEEKIRGVKELGRGLTVGFVGSVWRLKESFGLILNTKAPEPTLPQSPIVPVSPGEKSYAQPTSL